MAFIATPNGLKAFIKFSVVGGSAGLTFWAFTPDPTDPLQRSNLVLHLGNWVQTYLLPNLSFQVALESVEVSDQSSVSGGISTDVLTTPAPGLLTANALPLNVAFCITLQTSLRSKNYRGRSYAFGLTEPQTLSPEQWLTSAVAGMQSAYVALLAAVNLSGQYLAVASHHLNKLPRATGVLTPIQTVRANQRIASQRRRVPR